MKSPPACRVPGLLRRPGARLALLEGVALLLAAGSVRAQGVIERFPCVLRAGLAAGGEAREGDDDVLPDLPYQPERGYGHVGGRPGRWIHGGALGGGAGWLLAWREGPEKYLFRVPHGTYLVELSFVETEVAAPGLRVFDVVIENRALISGLDIFAEAGDFAWHTRSVVVSVVDGWLDLRLVPAVADRLPVISRIRISRPPWLAAEGTRGPRQLLAPTLRVAAGVEQNHLSWDARPGDGVDAYRLLRCVGSEGPLEPLETGSVRATRWVDTRVEVGKSYRYAVQALGVDGVESPPSAARDAVPLDSLSLGLRVYDLRLDATQTGRLLAWSEDGVDVEGQLHVLGAVEFVLVHADIRRERWGRKKSFRLLPDPVRNGKLFRREGLYLSAEADDATLLRARVCAELSARLGLATPAAEPVLLRLNGRLLGVYHDMEVLDRAFRRRSMLDRTGLLGEWTEGDWLRLDWKPFGQQLGESGNLMSLTELVHELNVVGEEETAALFQERFYLDRLFTRMALDAVRGGSSRLGAARTALLDSRNGKWELLDAGMPEGALGARAPGRAEWASLGEAALRQALWGKSAYLMGGAAPGGGRESPSTLDTRLAAQPRLRAACLDRLERCLREELDPAALDAIVDAAFQRVGRAAQVDPWILERSEEPARGARAGEASAKDSVAARAASTDSLAELLAGPGRLKAWLHEHRERLLGLLPNERRWAPSPLRIVRAIFRGPLAEVEVENVSEGDLELARFQWGASAEALLPGGGGVRRPMAATTRLAAGARWTLEVSFDPATAPDRILTLWQTLDPGLSPRLCDAVFVGLRLDGEELVRGGDGSWIARLAAGASAGAGAEVVAPLVPPPFLYLQGIDAPRVAAASSPGAPPRLLRAWLRLRGLEDPAARPAGVRLHTRRNGALEFEAVDVPWSQESLRYDLPLADSLSGERLEYYFSAISPGGAERRYPLPAPALVFAVPRLPVVKINEVLPRPGREPGSPGEFIEVYNPGTEPVDLEGYFLTDSIRNPTRWRIPEGAIVPPKGFLVFFGDGRNRGLHASFKLSNSGELVGLFGRMEEGNLRVDAMTFRGVRTGESWGASPDGSKSFRAWKDPTPGKRNIPRVPEEYLRRHAEGDDPGAAQGPLGGAEPRRRDEEAQQPEQPPEPGPGKGPGSGPGPGDGEETRHEAGLERSAAPQQGALETG